MFGWMAILGSSFYVCGVLLFMIFPFDPPHEGIGSVAAIAGLVLGPTMTERLNEYHQMRASLRKQEAEARNAESERLKNIRL